MIDKIKDFKGAIFDLDGTLLDSMHVWEDIDVAFLRRRGFEAPEDYTQAVKPMGFQAAAEYTINRFGLKERPEDLIEEWNRMSIAAYRNFVCLKPGAKDYLIWLRERGMKLAVATASQEALYVPALKHNGIYDYFDAFTIQDEVARGKGFPDIYLKAAEKLGLQPSDCFVVEDLYAGVRGAKDGGFFTVGMFDPSSEEDRLHIIEKADLYVMGFPELF